MQSTLQERARATSSAAAEEEARKRPSSAAAAAPSPRRNGEKGPACVFTRMQPCILASAPAFPSPRASGEKVVRQHRMRGRGRWGAIDVAAVRERRFISLAGEAEKRPSSAAAAAPSPRCHGEKGPACVFTRMQPCIPATAPAFPSPRVSGEKDRHALYPECGLAFFRRRQLSLRPAQRGEGTGMRFHQRAALHACDSASRPFAPRQRGEGGAAAPDEGPWEVGCD